MNKVLKSFFPENWQQQLVIFSITGLVLIILSYLTYPNITHTKLVYFIPVILILLMAYELGFLQFLGLKNNDFWQKNEDQWIWPLVLFCSSLLLNWGVLWDVWLGNYGNHYMLGGLLPNGDARQYFRGAEMLVELGQSQGRSLWRPLVTCFYAVLLKLTGGNMQFFLIMLTSLLSVSIYVAAKSVYRIFGITAGYLMLILVSSYYLYWNGTTMTEPVGLLFGNFAFALLCNGFYEKKRFLVYSGIFFLGIGLSARSGAMFVLPFLILGIAFFFKEKNIYNFKVIGISLVLAFFAFTISLPLVKIVGQVANSEAGNSYQGSYAYTFYGLVSGGKSWKYVYKKYPELKGSKGGLSQSEKSSLIYNAAFEKLKKEPMLFVGSILTSYRHIILHPFKYFTFKFKYCSIIFLIPFIFIFIAPFYHQNEADKRVLYMIFLGALGVFLSAPFIVTIGSDVFKAGMPQIKYATTMAFNAALIAVGLGLLIQFIKAKFLTKENEVNPLTTNDFNQSIKSDHLSKNFDALWPTLLVVSLFLGVIVFRLTAVGNYEFKTGLDDLCKRSIAIVRLEKGSFINFVDNSQKTLVPNVRIEDFEKYLLSRKSKSGYVNPKVGQKMVIGTNYYKGENSATGYAHLLLRRSIKEHFGKMSVICTRKKGIRVRHGKVVKSGFYHE